jgi:protein-tyrosine phosphatase
LLVVDGSGVCRAPIVAFTLGRQLAVSEWRSETTIETRGLSAEAGRTMCENAAARIGYSGPAIAYFGSYRAVALSVADIARADLVITAERSQRSALVRMLPGIQASVFTWKEALLLADVVVDRRQAGSATAPTDIAGLARALHGARGAVPLIEPSVRTGPLHWRRAAGADPLTIESGHRPTADHRHVTQESFEIADALATRLKTVMRATTGGIAARERSGLLRRLRRSA